MDMALTAEFYRYLHQIEENYGSVSKAPDNDLNLIAVHHLIEKNNAEREIRALDLLKQGTSEYSTSMQTGIVITKIKRMRQSHHIPLVPVFHYQIDNIYFPTTHQIARYYHHDETAILNRLRYQGKRIIKNEFIWKNIPINGEYVARNSKLYVKKSSNINTFLS